LLLVFILIAGDTYSKISTLFSLLGISVGSKDYYDRTVIPDVDGAVAAVTERILRDCWNQTPHKDDMYIMLDAGWSHPGWWAKECTVIALDGKTGLPVEVVHVIKGKNGYNGSSRGLRLQL